MARDFRTLIKSPLLGLLTLIAGVLTTCVLPSRIVFGQETTKPAEPPLDESVNVQALLDARLATEDLDLGWIRLFDGQSLLGWKATSEVDWKVEKGEIGGRKVRCL